MKTVASLLLILPLAACSGGPLKELPVLEAPPPEPDPAPAPPPPAPELYGAWTSTRLSGPGSAAFEGLIACFERDGRCSFAAFGKEPPQARAGRFRAQEGLLELDLSGERRKWSYSFEGEDLRLKAGDADARFRRLR